MRSEWLMVYNSLTAITSSKWNHLSVKTKCELPNYHVSSLGSHAMPR